MRVYFSGYASNLTDYWQKFFSNGVSDFPLRRGTKVLTSHYIHASKKVNELPRYIKHKILVESKVGVVVVADPSWLFNRKKASKRETKNTVIQVQVVAYTSVRVGKLCISAVYSCMRNPEKLSSPSVSSLSFPLPLSLLSFSFFSTFFTLSFFSFSPSIASLPLCLVYHPYYISFLFSSFYRFSPSLFSLPNSISFFSPSL